MECGWLARMNYRLDISEEAPAQLYALPREQRRPIG
jgi:mRNA-degrading endonuclease RelE of RelBE toxin-antitoxin system